MQQKSWAVALILSIFLGGLGIDRFYLGYTGKGILNVSSDYPRLLPICSREGIEISAKA